MLKNIFWDFDGVIIDSMKIRDFGFRTIFKEFDKNLVEKFIEYHNFNAGLSRFHKIKYFYNKFLNKEIEEGLINQYADKFSYIMREKLYNKDYLIYDSIDFIKQNYKNLNFHIVSGSEHNELNFLCEKLDLKQYFKSINGSPTPKTTLVSQILKDENYEKQNTILIGDSINDYEAALSNQINFYGYNNENLRNKSKIYIENFRDFIKQI